MRAIENDIAVEVAVIRTLIYFDLFNYPLTSEEVFQFLQTHSTKGIVEEALNALVSEGKLTRKSELYSMQTDPALFERRKAGNALANLLLPRVTEQANLIAKFPFVRSVMASGSFSKNYMDETSDFDFFIVCAPNRIWISRMLLVAYKKLVLKNSHKHFCVNYFIDENHLEIDEKNIFTATELATVLPLTGFDQYARLIESNKTWLATYFPHFQPRQIITGRNSGWQVKRSLEFVLNVFFGTQLNRLFKWVTIRKWKRTYSHYPSSDFNIAFKSTEGVSKNHPRNFQKIILETYQLRIATLIKKLEAA
jgi:hypothetical protein